MRSGVKRDRSAVSYLDTDQKKKETGNGLISIKDLTITYSYGDPFYIPSLSFAKGEITSILGKNGCGKTTLIRTIAGMLPYRGSIQIEGKECREYRGAERSQKISYLPQMIKAVNMDVQTLTEHGRYPWHGNYRRLSKEDKAYVAEALAITGMNVFKDRDLTELSGGQLRRAYLSMIIAQNADIILLDEPTTYMDIESQALFYEIAGKLAAKGCGVIMTCHNIEQGFSYSDQIVIMEDRHVKQTGTPIELAKEKESFREIFGAAVKESEDADSLYPYVLIK